MIGVLYGNKKARYRVLRVRCDGNGEKMQVAVHRLDSDACPWLDLLVEEAESDRHLCMRLCLSELDRPIS